MEWGYLPRALAQPSGRLEFQSGSVVIDVSPVQQLGVVPKPCNFCNAVLVRALTSTGRGSVVMELLGSQRRVIGLLSGSW
jgi:hypothetical protein